MDKMIIALKKFQAVVEEGGEQTGKLSQKENKGNKVKVLTFNAHLMSQGYVLSSALFEDWVNTSSVVSDEYLVRLMAAVKPLRGSHVKHKPMYPNFPQQVMDATEAELYGNALLHYYSYGDWLPNYAELPGAFAFEAIKFQEIELIAEEQFRTLFTTLLASEDSLSAEDQSIVHWFLQQEYAGELKIPDEIPFHENKCLVAAAWLEQGIDIAPFIKTATDILRLVTYLSDGDASLAENTRFKSLSRSKRRQLVQQLERVINEEDIGRHRNKWVRLFHNLHVGDYASCAAKTFRIAKKARNSEALASFYSHLEAAIQARDIERCVHLLSTRPGEFGRRLDHLLRIAAEMDAIEKHQKGKKALLSFTGLRKQQHQQKSVAEAFLQVVDKIPTRNLLQLSGHLKTRSEVTHERIIFPKGSLQNAVIVPTYLGAMDGVLLQSLQQGIRQSLLNCFATQDALQKVWIAPELIDCPLPAQQRSASAGLHNMARGTRLPLVLNDTTLRFFVYWKGMDIDLSATFHTEDAQMIEQVSYTNLKSDKYRAYHSGDITHAPQGASEFIDINIASVPKHARYLAMNVLVFNGPSFAEHETCFVGWMSRSKPASNEVFEPATVQQKIDLEQHCRSVMPVVFDLHARQVVWADLPVSRSGFYHNNVESSQATIQQKLQAILKVNNKLSLYELFELHASARGELVETEEEADTVFALNQGVTPFDVHTINAEFM